MFGPSIVADWVCLSVSRLLSYLPRYERYVMADGEAVMLWIIGAIWIVLAVVIYRVPPDGPDDFQNHWTDSTLFGDFSIG